jgi:tetratricopeptide (TPR) repeat protein
MFLFRFILRELMIFADIVAVAGRLSVRWLKTRSWRRSILLLLAAASVLSVMVLGLLSSWKAWNSRLLEQYLSEARSATVEGDPGEAQLKYRRALRMSGNPPELLFEYARSLQQLGETAEGLRQFAVIAPVRGSVRFLEAHRYLSEQDFFDNERQNDIFRAMHLMQIIRHSPDARAERRKLLDLLTKHREYDQAIQLLQETFAKFPEDRLIVARLRARQGQLKEARDEALVATEDLARQLREFPTNESTRLALAQGQIFLGQFGAALVTLTNGLVQKDSISLRRAAGETVAAWHSTLSPEQMQQQEDVLASLLRECSAFDSSRKDSAIRQFQDRMAKPVPEWLLRSLSGAALAGSQQWESAEQELRTALRLRQEDAIAQNNLAWVLLQRAEMTGDTADAAEKLSEARRLIDLAVETAPEVADLRETRARILIRQNEPQKAVLDLRFCLQHGLETRIIHSALADCLDELGLKDEAVQHRRKAELVP